MRLEPMAEEAYWWEWNGRTLHDDVYVFPAKLVVCLNPDMNAAKKIVYF